MEVPAPAVDASRLPLTAPTDGNGRAFMFGTVVEDRASPAAILSLAVGYVATTFQAGSEIVLQDAGQLNLYVDITWGSATSVTVAFFPRRAVKAADFREISTNVASGVATCSPYEYKFLASEWAGFGNPRIPVPVNGDVSGVVKVKGAGTLGSTAVTVYYTRSPGT